MPARPITEGLFDGSSDPPRLHAARCETCRKPHFPASMTCPYCGGDRVAAILVGPAGTLRLFTAVRTRPPGYGGAVPFGFGVVELDGAGLEVIARLTEADPARLRPGLPVTLVVEPFWTADDGTTVLTYAFAPVAAS